MLRPGTGSAEWPVSQSIAALRPVRGEGVTWMKTRAGAKSFQEFWIGRGGGKGKRWERRGDWTAGGNSLPRSGPIDGILWSQCFGDLVALVRQP